MCPSKETPRVWTKACSGIKYSSGEVTIPTTCVGRETRQLVNVAAAFSSYGNSMLSTLHIRGNAVCAQCSQHPGISTFLFGISSHFYLLVKPYYLAGTLGFPPCYHLGHVVLRREH